MVYWGASVKIKALNKNQHDPLCSTRIVTFLFGCNNRISNARFKGTLNDYGYSTHGDALYHPSLLRANHLAINPKVEITINVRFACKCTKRQLCTNKYNQYCEIHKDGNKKKRKHTFKNAPLAPKRQRIDTFFKSSEMI